MYDFKKLRLQDRSIACYEHPLFRRDRVDLLCHIRRQTHKDHPKKMNKRAMKEIGKQTENALGSLQSKHLVVSIPLGTKDNKQAARQSTPSPSHRSLVGKKSTFQSHFGTKMTLQDTNVNTCIRKTTPPQKLPSPEYHQNMRDPNNAKKLTLKLSKTILKQNDRDCKPEAFFNFFRDAGGIGGLGEVGRREVLQSSAQDSHHPIN